MNDSLDAIVIRVKVPQDVVTESEERTREITADEAEAMAGVNLLAFACQSST